jgi:hypothetical protein
MAVKSPHGRCTESVEKIDEINRHPTAKIPARPVVAAVRWGKLGASVNEYAPLGIRS